MTYRSPRTILLCGLAAAGLAVAALAMPATAEETSLFAPQLVTVDTPTRAAKADLQRLGLDLTEHAGHDYIEVVLHTSAERDALRAAGFTYDVRIPDLLRREAEINATDSRYAAATAVSPLPSGRDEYRSLADYQADLKKLAEDNPGLVRLIELPHKSLDGRTTYGVEIANRVADKDGRPTFAMFGLHHAREWPSGEHAMEFAVDLVKNRTQPRIAALLEKGRIVVVPVVNPDGFHLSYEDGQKVDLRALRDLHPLGGTAALATPNNAYKRKNCRVVDGQDTPDGTCAAFSASSPVGYGLGVDLNRNYGGLWGGPGASELFPDPTYRGAGPFSEPETQNIRELISGRQVTMMISNHTFSNLVLRPNGVDPQTTGPDGHPVGYAPDEAAMAELGASMTAQNGYRNIHGWELYDTTGTTEDWSYNATGGYGYTFEIGPNEFHPPFEQVVNEYVGAEDFAGKGNREAYLLAFENAVDTAHHAVLTGKAPLGATLRLRKNMATPTWEASISDTLESTMTTSGKSYTWHVNQSTRPIVQQRRYDVLAEEPTQTWHFDGTAIEPGGHRDHRFTMSVPDQEIMQVDLDWPTPDDLDLEVYQVTHDDDGNEVLERVGGSGNFVAEKEKALISNPVGGADYVVRVVNFASTTATYTVDVGVFNADSHLTPANEALIEAYTLTCEKDGRVLQRVPVIIDRGQRVKLDLTECARRW